MTMTRFLGTATVVSLLGVTLTPPAAAVEADWREQIGTFAIGILGGENESDRLRRNECLQALMAEELEMPVELFMAADFAGVLQGLLAGQLHMAGLGASGYAAIHLQDPDAVEVVATRANIDGSLGYYSVMVVRADSDIHTIEDMEGRSLAFADPNSTSGFLVPRGELRRAGIDETTFFGRTGFAGGHEQGVIAVLNGQFDAMATWSSLLGEFEEGFSRGNLRRMVDNGLLDMNDLRIVWQSELIPNGPTVLRTDLPEEARELVLNFLLTMQEEHPECYRLSAGGDDGGFVPIDHSFFVPVIEMRRAELEQSR
ncbi:MAG: phosphonate ABC transporter substrate-binding protein [Alkalilacustris sp.]